MSAPIRFVATQAQRQSLLTLFMRHNLNHFDSLLASDIARESEGKWKFHNPFSWRQYRVYRKRFRHTGVCGDYYLFGQPYGQGEGNIWVGIETDGYCHS